YNATLVWFRVDIDVPTTLSVLTLVLQLLHQFATRLFLSTIIRYYHQFEVGDVHIHKDFAVVVAEIEFMP
ncbi:2554_t:CDS:2, partial [Acaulospora morrowiae]